MDWLSPAVMSFGVAISIMTSLFIGLSLVEINLQYIIKKIIYLSLIAGMFNYLSTFIIDTNLFIMMIYVLFIPVIIYYFKVPISQGLLASMLALTFHLTIILLLAYNLMDIAITISDVPNDPVMRIAFTIFIAFTNIFMTLIIYYKKPVLFSKNWFNLHVIEESQKNIHKMHFIFIIVILVVMNAFVYMTLVEIPYLRMGYRIFLSCWGIVICSFFLFFSKQIVVYSIERMQFSLDKLYQKDLQSFYHIIRSQRHDFNIHLNTINGLIQNKKFDESHHYIKKIVQEASDINELLPLHYPEIGAMLYTYKELALQKGIELQFTIKDNLRTMPCSIYEMNKILGNLLQNAIEAVDEGVIELTIEKEYDQISLRVANEFDGDLSDLEKMFSSGFSTKSTHEGIGLPTIQSIISKFNGVIYPEFKDDQLIMNIRLSLIQ